MNCLSTTLLIIKNQAICIKNYAIQKGKINEDQVNLMKERLDKIKKEIKNMPKNKKNCD